LFGKPTGRLWIEGIRPNDADLDVIALRTFKQPMFETDRPRCDTLQHHPRLAMGTTRALNRGQEFIDRGHDTSLSGGSVTELSVTDGYLWRGGDGTIMTHCNPPPLVNIAHSRKFHE
jgi:hypothetical protein